MEIHFRECGRALWGAANESFPRKLLECRRAVVSCRVQFEQWVAFPLEQVFLFFSKPSNLPRIMPPAMGTRLVRLSLVPRPSPGSEAGTGYDGLAWVGSEIITSFRVLPRLPWRAEWIAQIVEFDWNHHFTDVQRKGPFKSFHHRHEFAAVRRNGVNGTIVRDVIHYEVGFGVFGWLARKLVLTPQMQRTFEYRQTAVEKLLAQDALEGQPSPVT